MDYASEIRIAAPRWHVWPILVDVEEWPSWSRSFSSLKIISAGQLRVGSAVAIKKPKLSESVWTVSDWAAGRSFAWVSRRPGLTATADHELVERGDHCVFRQTISIEGLLGRVRARIGGGLITELLRSEALALKQMAETTFAAPTVHPLVLQQEMTV
jgi:Polyketide cyclase / dehydrase and lipid transport